MQKPSEILKKYWGYDKFRPLQEDIINSVIQGKDTLALLPTGGGKSICFQVPGLCTSGICLVISPLIALMKDQVENLKKKGIPAIAITSELHATEISIALEHCERGEYKFLYLSPERLQSEMVQMRLQKMNINLIAVDEAHCISQWGYDFRPSYLRIAELRNLLPDVTILALTATATPEVVDDIMAKLSFPAKNIFFNSYGRSNLTYMVLKEENKLERLLKILHKIQGSAIIYARNRKQTQELSKFLIFNKISATHYHAGLDAQTRANAQEMWKTNKLRVMCATNAFGMGIDKPDVRVVIHMDLPDSPEAYFQEAGRAGRDEQHAYGVILFSDSDILSANDLFNISFPDKAEIRRSYQALGNFFNIPLGGGLNQVFDFDLLELCAQYKLNHLIVFSSLKFLEKEGLITLTDAIFQPSRVMITAGKDTLYDYQLRHPDLDGFIKLMLRSYGGLHNDFAKIDERLLDRRLGYKEGLAKEYLLKLHQQNILEYIPQTSKPQLIFLHERVDSQHLTISKAVYDDRKEIARQKLNAVIDYTQQTTICRNRYLLAYLGEKNILDCGKCDVCLSKKKNVDASQYHDKIFEALKDSQPTIKELIQIIKPNNEDTFVSYLQGLIDDGVLMYENERLSRA